MAFPLVPGAVSVSGVSVVGEQVPVTTFSYTRSWSPILPRARSAPGVTVIGEMVPFVRFAAVRIWSGAVSRSTWPAYGQGWPRIIQR